MDFLRYTIYLGGFSMATKADTDVRHKVLIFPFTPQNDFIMLIQVLPAICGAVHFQCALSWRYPLVQYQPCVTDRGDGQNPRSAAQAMEEPL